MNIIRTNSRCDNSAIIVCLQEACCISNSSNCVELMALCLRKVNKTTGMACIWNGPIVVCNFCLSRQFFSPLKHPITCYQMSSKPSHRIVELWIVFVRAGASAMVVILLLAWTRWSLYVIRASIVQDKWNSITEYSCCYRSECVHFLGHEWQLFFGTENIAVLMNSEWWSNERWHKNRICPLLFLFCLFFFRSCPTDVCVIYSTLSADIRIISTTEKKNVLFWNWRLQAWRRRQNGNHSHWCSLLFMPMNNTGRFRILIITSTCLLNVAICNIRIRIHPQIRAFCSMCATSFIRMNPKTMR